MCGKLLKSDRKEKTNIISCKVAHSVILASLIFMTLAVVECGEGTNITVLLGTFQNNVLVG